jgi:hypothetical protein
VVKFYHAKTEGGEKKLQAPLPFKALSAVSAL